MAELERQTHWISLARTPEAADGSITWWTTCSCGWRSRPWPSKRDADSDADEHVCCMVRAED